MNLLVVIHCCFDGKLLYYMIGSKTHNSQPRKMGFDFDDKQGGVS